MSDATRGFIVGVICAAWFFTPVGYLLRVRMEQWLHESKPLPTQRPALRLIPTAELERHAAEARN